MNAHKIEGGRSVNIIVVDSLDALPGVELVDADLHGGSIGDTWDGQRFTPPTPTPAPVPDEVLMSAARKALMLAGVTDSMVRSAIAASALSDTDKQLALIDWEFHPTVQRSSPLVALLAPALGLTQSQVDDLFREAAK